MDGKSQSVAKDSLLLALLGAVTLLGYAFLNIDIGDRKLTSAEAWRLGVSQPYVLGGVVLLLLSWLVYRRVHWARWLVLAWFPVTFGGGMAWSLFRGVSAFDTTEFVLEGFPVLCIWLWFSWRTFFHEPHAGG